MRLFPSKRSFFFCAISALLSGYGAVAEATPQSPLTNLELVAPKVIVVDGQLDEPVYQQGDWQKDFKVLTTGETTPLGTAFRVLTDGSTLFFAAKIAEPGGKVMAEERDHDGPVWQDDCLEFFLQANEDASEFLQILVNARGDVTDIKYGQGGHTKELQWNTSAKAATQTRPEGWDLELAVPLAELGVNPALKSWKLQVARERAPRADESQLITAWPFADGALGRIDSFGELKLPDFDRSLLGWKLTAGDPKVIRASGGYYLRQPIRLLNQTGQYRNVVLNSSLTSDPLARGKKTFGLASGRAADVETEIFLGDQPTRSDFLRHEVTISQMPEQMLSFLSQELAVEYLPTELKLIAPGYRSSIFASQNLETIVAELKQVDENLTIRKVAAILRGEDGQEREATVEKDGKLRWKIAVGGARSLPDGEYTLEVRFEADEKTQKMERVITKLPFQEGEVWIDEKGVVHREGKPFPAYGFCFGYWDKMDEKRFPGMKINVAAPVWAVPPFESMHKEVDHLANYGIYSVAYIATGSKSSYQPMGKNPLTEREKEEYRAVAKAARNHPWIIAYYLFDEPDCNGLHPVRLKEIYDLVREEDPYRPIIVLNNSLEGTRDYQYGADISAPDPYPLFLENGGASSPLAKIGMFLDQVVTGEESFRARWLTPQGFNYGNYNAEGNRGPTAAEMRSQQIIGLIHGASGITWYTEYLVWDEPGVFVSLPYLSQEFSALFPLFASARPERIDAGEGGTAGLSVDGDQVLLMAANLLFEEREVTLRDPRLAAVKTWKKLGTGETLPGERSEITVKLKPFEGIILASDKVPFPKELDWTEVEKAEAVAWEKSRTPGNIAHRLAGTKIRGINTTPSAHLRPTMVNDGMKDPRGSGFEQARFEPGMGIEIDLGQDRNPARLVVIGSNVASARLEQQSTDGAWEPLATLTSDGKTFSQEISLPAKSARRLRLLVDQLSTEDGKLQIREIEIYEK